MHLRCCIAYLLWPHCAQTQWWCGTSAFVCPACLGLSLSESPSHCPCQETKLTSILLCRQWSGVNGVSFFAPQIFAGVNALGEGNEGSLIAAVIVNGVQLIATIITVFIVDKVGRRSLLISGSMLGFASEIAVAIVFAVSAGTNAVSLPYGASIAAIVLVGCLALFVYVFTCEVLAVLLIR